MTWICDVQPCRGLLFLHEHEQFPIQRSRHFSLRTTPPVLKFESRRPAINGLNQWQDYWDIHYDCLTCTSKSLVKIYLLILIILYYLIGVIFYWLLLFSLPLSLFLFFFWWQTGNSSIGLCYLFIVLFIFVKYQN